MENKVRSKEDEAALDEKIAEIHKKNQLIELRKEQVDKDRAKFTNELKKTKERDVKLEINAQARRISTEKNVSVKDQWDREWDTGKTSAEKWKENVPEMERSNRAGHTWGMRRRGQGTRGVASRSGGFMFHDDRSNPQSKSAKIYHSEKENGKGAYINSSRNFESSGRSLRRSTYSSNASRYIHRTKRESFTRGRGMVSLSSSSSTSQQDSGRPRGVENRVRRGGGARNRFGNVDSIKVTISSLRSGRAVYNGKALTPPTANGETVSNDDDTIVQIIDEMVAMVIKES